MISKGDTVASTIKSGERRTYNDGGCLDSSVESWIIVAANYSL